MQTNIIFNYYFIFPKIRLATSQEFGVHLDLLSKGPDDVGVQGDLVLQIVVLIERHGGGLLVPAP